MPTPADADPPRPSVRRRDVVGRRDPGAKGGDERQGRPHLVDPHLEAGQDVSVRPDGGAESLGRVNEGVRGPPIELEAGRPAGRPHHPEFGGVSPVEHSRPHEALGHQGVGGRQIHQLIEPLADLGQLGSARQPPHRGAAHDDPTAEQAMAGERRVQLQEALPQLERPGVGQPEPDVVAQRPDVGGVVVEALHLDQYPASAAGRRASPRGPGRPLPPGSRRARGRRWCPPRSARPATARRRCRGPRRGARSPCGRTTGAPSCARSSRPRPRTGSARARSIRHGPGRPGSRRRPSPRPARTGRSRHRPPSAAGPRPRGASGTTRPASADAGPAALVGGGPPAGSRTGPAAPARTGWPGTRPPRASGLPAGPGRRSGAARPGGRAGRR